MGIIPVQNGWVRRQGLEPRTRRLRVGWSYSEHHVRVFHLAEGELSFGLGPVPGDDLGYGPVVVIGDQHVLAEDFLFQRGAGGRGRDS